MGKLPPRDRCLSLLALPEEHDHRDVAHGAWGGANHADGGLWLFPDRVAGAGQGFRPGAGNSIYPVSGPYHCTFRHLRKAAVDQYVQAVGCAVLLLLPARAVLDLLATAVLYADTV